MAGHSKWANIKYRKERADAAKGKLFSRITKEIISAVKQGGTDPKVNQKLRIAIDKAKVANLPNDNIERNIKKASQTDQNDYFEMTYELYGHGGVGILIEAMTDNKNRMSSDLRIATNKKGGTIATPGSVLFNFDRKGIIQISSSLVEEEKALQMVIEAGAEDFEVVDGLYLVTTAPEELYKVAQCLERQGVSCKESDLEMIPKVYVACDLESAQANTQLIDWLGKIEDVDRIFHNMITDETPVD